MLSLAVELDEIFWTDDGRRFVVESNFTKDYSLKRRVRGG